MAASRRLTRVLATSGTTTVHPSQDGQLYDAYDALSVNEVTAGRVNFSRGDRLPAAERDRFAAARHRRTLSGAASPGETEERSRSAGRSPAPPPRPARGGPRQSPTH